MPLTPGTRLGPYEILAAAGVGGMGEVYRARDTKLGRQVALKIVPRAFAADRERLGRFEREAKVLAALSHPNIAAVYGVEESGEGPALVMELAEGATLADRIAGGRIAAEEALPIAQQICEALEYAHERGIVHRDLKPANVKVTPEGVVKVLDFGLAKALEGEAQATEISNSPTITHMATRAGIILGTAAYMSPEQAKGKPADRRADIWAFGCVLYEMLTGRMAFRGETVTDVLADVIRGEPKWALLPADTPPAVRSLIQRCLKKDVKQRLQAIGDARIAIEEARSGSATAEGVAAVPVGAVPQPRRRTLPWMAALVACAGIAAVGAWTVASRRAQPATMRFQTVTNFAGVQAEPALSPDGHSLAFVSNRDGHYNIYVGLVAGGSLVQVTRDANVKSRPRWSPDGTLLVYARLNDSGTWDIWQVPALGGTARRLILNAKEPDWSPDGRSLTYDDLASRTIWISDASGQNARQVSPDPDAGLHDADPRFSPDGREIAFISRTGGPYGNLMVVEIASGKARALTQDLALALSPAWSPDGRSLYFSSSRGGTMNIWKISAAGGEPEQVTAGQGDDAQLDISSDGKRIIFSTFRENRNLAQLDLPAKAEAPEVKLLTTDPARSQVAPVYSPDGKHLAYFSNLNGAEREGIWVANSDGSEAVGLVQDGRVNVFPRWAPDGQHLVYFSRPVESMFRGHSEYRRVSIAGGAPETLMGNASDLHFDVGGDGRLLFQAAEGKIQSYDPATKKLETLGSLPKGEVCDALRWSPDGHSVAYIVAPSRDDDPQAGLWVEDFKGPPRQLFQGWVVGETRGPESTIYFFQGKAELTAVLWKIGWDGKGLSRISGRIPLTYSFWDTQGVGGSRFFEVAPDGRHLAFVTQGVLQANIGMIENVR